MRLMGPGNKIPGNKKGLFKFSVFGLPTPGEGVKIPRGITLWEGS